MKRSRLAPRNIKGNHRKLSETVLHLRALLMSGNGGLSVDGLDALVRGLAMTTVALLSLMGYEHPATGPGGGRLLEPMVVAVSLVAYNVLVIALEGAPRAIIEGFGQVGIRLLPLAFIAATLVLFLSTLDLGEQAIQHRKQQSVALAMYLSLFGTLTVAASFFPAASWLETTYSIMSLVALVWVGRHALGSQTLDKASKWAVASVVLAYAGWFYYIIMQVLGARWGWGWGGAGVVALNIGEIVALAAPFLFFAAVALPNREWVHPKRWILPAIVTLMFAAGNVADMVFDQGFTGVFTLWSVGFTHFLPWPLYALALAAYIYAVLTCFSRDTKKAAFANPNTGLGLLLLLFAGYNLQLTYQHLLALLAMMLFAGIARPFADDLY